MKTIGKFNSYDKTLIIRENSKGDYIGELYQKDNVKRGEWISKATFEGKDATEYRVMEYFNFNVEPVRIKAILDWTIPYFGNHHIMPYGTLLVQQGDTVLRCKTKGDLYTDNDGYQYITFKRKRYEVINRGRLHSPQLELRAI